MTSPSFAPRRATLVDVPAIARVINRAYVVERFFKDGDRTSEEDVRVLMSRPHVVFLVVDDGASPSELAGSVHVEVKGTRGYFGMLSVDPKRQGSGLARLLIEAAEEHCRVRGCTFMDISVVNLRTDLPAFYAKFGYAPYGTAPLAGHEPLTRKAHLVLMTKPLVPLW